LAGQVPLRKEHINKLRPYLVAKMLSMAPSIVGLQMVKTLKSGNFEWPTNPSLSRLIKKSHTRFIRGVTIPRVHIGYYLWTLFVFVAVVAT
jgi:hypothetical protein